MIEVGKQITLSQRNRIAFNFLPDVNLEFDKLNIIC